MTRACLSADVPPAQDLLAGDFRGLARRHPFGNPSSYFLEVALRVALAVDNFARVEEVGHLLSPEVSVVFSVTAASWS